MAGQHDGGSDDGWSGLALIAIPVMLAGLIWQGLTWPFRKLIRAARKDQSPAR